MHRIVLLAVKHDGVVDPESIKVNNWPFDLAEYLTTTKGQISGLSFFQTVWTKQTSPEGQQRIFGEVKEAYAGPPQSRFTIH